MCYPQLKGCLRLWAWFKIHNMQIGLIKTSFDTCLHTIGVNWWQASTEGSLSCTPPPSSLNQVVAGAVKGAEGQVLVSVTDETYFKTNPVHVRDWLVWTQCDLYNLVCIVKNRKKQSSMTCGKF